MLASRFCVFNAGLKVDADREISTMIRRQLTKGMSILRTGPDQSDRKPEITGVFYGLDQKLPTAGLKV